MEVKPTKFNYEIILRESIVAPDIWDIFVRISNSHRGKLNAPQTDFESEDWTVRLESSAYKIYHWLGVFGLVAVPPEDWEAVARACEILSRHIQFDLSNAKAIAPDRIRPVRGHFDVRRIDQI